MLFTRRSAVCMFHSHETHCGITASVLLLVAPRLVTAGVFWLDLLVKHID